MTDDFVSRQGLSTFIWCFKSMPNDYELLCLYTFEDRVKESSFVFRGLSSHSRIVHSYGDVTIRAANFVLYMLVTHGH